MLFDVYTPTRTPRHIEVRIRTTLDGPFRLVAKGEARVLGEPSISWNGHHFFRHPIADLRPDTPVPIEVHHLESGRRVRLTAATLPRPAGPTKLRVGILADLHLPPAPRPFEQYRAGTRRLTGLAAGLAATYIKRLEALGADLIVLPGDLVDPCTPETLDQLERILGAVDVPTYPIIGNHEPWSAGGEALFNRALGLPPEGYYAVRRNGVRLLMLRTPSQDALRSGSAQRRWLERQLQDAAPAEDIVLFSHFSLRLHPCVQGPRNDGYQLLDQHRDIRALLAAHPNVRLFIAGHKNVPSMVRKDGVIHTLSPQLIQSPCGYDIFHLYDGGVQRTTYEIDEQHYCELARAAYAHDWPLRYGDERGRNFCVEYT